MAEEKKPEASKKKKKAKESDGEEEEEENDDSKMERKEEDAGGEIKVSNLKDDNEDDSRWLVSSTLPQTASTTSLTGLPLEQVSWQETQLVGSKMHLGVIKHFQEL